MYLYHSLKLHLKYKVFYLLPKKELHIQTHTQMPFLHHGIVLYIYLSHVVKINSKTPTPFILQTAWYFTV